MLIDYHVHNHFSPDSEADSSEIIKQELKNGVTEICFTNHAEWFDNKSPNGEGVLDEEEFTRRFESIRWEIDHLKSQHPEITLKFGMEFNFKTPHAPLLKKLIESQPLDFVLGGVHTLDEIVIASHKYSSDYFKTHTEEEAYGHYFSELKKMVEWGHLDAVAHFDICKKYGHQWYGPFKPEKYESVIRPILKTMKTKGIALELNSGSLHSRCKELFPHPAILKWALEEGLTLFTLSSDAHQAGEAGKSVPEAAAIAKKLGITQIAVFEKRKSSFRSL